MNENSNNEINTSGWDAITEACEKLYPNQTNPIHYAALIKWRFGGNDPLDGISIYDAGDCYHFVTYGMSELYEKKSDNKELSGFGMEFTFKLKKDNYLNEEAEIKCICGILQTLARITFNNGGLFKPNEYIYTGQTSGIDVNKKSIITGFITIMDNDLKIIDTPNGKVTFVELIGATNSELLAIKNKELDVNALYEKIGSDITDYNRDSVV